MKRVTGIGGVFIKAKDPGALQAWYRQHLGIDVQEWGGAVFESKPAGESASPESTVWCIFPASSTYFDPSQAPFMVNYRVENLDALLEALRAEGCDVDPKSQDSEHGRFGWVMDPEGNRIELWQPPAGNTAG